VSAGFSKTIVRWNAGINYLFLKEKKGQLKLSVNGLLKQNTNAYRWVSENYIYDSESNALTRYFMFTFTYNIRDFKGGKVGGRQSLSISELNNDIVQSITVDNRSVQTSISVNVDGSRNYSMKWNAALNITLMKNEAVVLKLAVNDILNRNNSILVNANHYTE
jgi:Outer membrane protein beta-barrel family